MAGNYVATLAELAGISITPVQMASTNVAPTQMASMNVTSTYSQYRMMADSLNKQVAVVAVTHQIEGLKAHTKSSSSFPSQECTTWRSHEVVDFGLRNK